MTLYKCKCIGCNHNFYSLHVECKELHVVNCPLCHGGVEVEDVDKPSEAEWSKCKKSKKCGNCSGC